MHEKTCRVIENQISMIERRLSNAKRYLTQNINLTGSSAFHLDDWQGNSGHPSWMKNVMIPRLTKNIALKEYVWETIANKSKKKRLAKRKQARNHSQD